MRVLGIETSCDETAAAVVENGRAILSSLVASQVELHAQYGGVFPEVASRQHIRAISPIVEGALQQAHLDLALMGCAAQHRLRHLARTTGPGMKHDQQVFHCCRLLNTHSAPQAIPSAVADA